MSNTRAHAPELLQGFFLGGFECSAHRRPDGRRLDLLAATEHDARAAADYRAMRRHGLRSVRDGLRWHLIETAPGHYDWSSFLPMLRASRAAGLQVIWDLCHYGWPDDIDVWSPAFVDRFARFAAAAARVIADEGEGVPFYCPVNEISYWAWAGGEVGHINPCATGRGAELKRQLVRASIAAIEAVRGVDRRARIVHVEPAIHVLAARPEDHDVAEGYRRSQWEAYDLLAGRLAPELGGAPAHLDIVGLNFYPENQWFHGGGTIPLGHFAYRPFRDILGELGQRYGRPLLVAETGAEGGARPAWLHYVGGEVRAALAAGVPVEGVCLYPIVDYPGWKDERACNVGLLGVPVADARPVYAPLAEELARQQAYLAEYLRREGLHVDLEVSMELDRRVG